MTIPTMAIPPTAILLNALPSSKNLPEPEDGMEAEPDEETSEPTIGAETQRVWQRVPVEGVAEFSLRPGNFGPWSPDPDHPDMYVRGLVRRRDSVWTITLFLVNAQAEPKSNKDEAWVFQPELSVRAPEGAPVFVKRTLPAELQTDHREDRAIELLYRCKFR